MRVGIVGAGFAGLTTAKTMLELGHDVVVVDRTPDVGGVWSATRRYPGLTTQNNRSTYGFSDFPMPSDYPEFPSGEQVQAYLQSYAEAYGLGPHLRLSTEVVATSLDEATGRWTMQLRGVEQPDGAGSEETVEVDHLVVCNGIFSDPSVPDYPGADAYAAAGGRLRHASAFTDAAEARGRSVVVVGYGKSSCDVAAAVSGVATSTTVVAREIIWKMPKQLAGLSYKYLLLTRMGEALFRYIEPVGFERFLHGLGKPVRDSMLRSVQALVTKQLRLRETGLLPEGSLERIARSTVSLASDGFHEQVADGTVVVRGKASIVRLGAVDGRPVAELADGTVLPADLVVCGTGYHQRVPFLPADVQERLTDERGNFVLYRQILPIGVPGLTFNGYNSSFFSPLSAEVASLWTGQLLDGGLALPTPDAQRAHVAERLRWMEERTEGKHARGTNIIPFSVHNIDEMLVELDVRLPRRTRLLQWLLPVDPRSYTRVRKVVLDRQTVRPVRPAHQPAGATGRDGDGSDDGDGNGDGLGDARAA